MYFRFIYDGNDFMDNISNHRSSISSSATLWPTLFQQISKQNEYQDDDGLIVGYTSNNSFLKRCFDFIQTMTPLNIL